MSDALTGLRKSLNSILSIRDKVAIIHAVFQVTRRWSGSEIGEGEFVDEKVRMLPTPGFREFGNDVRLNEAGAIKQGDIILKGISKVNYPTEKDLDCSSADASTERFWLIDDKEYTTINIKESYLTWDVQVRKRSGRA
jgi:hypothetical protein